MYPLPEGCFPSFYLTFRRGAGPFWDLTWITGSPETHVHRKALSSLQTSGSTSLLITANVVLAEFSPEVILPRRAPVAIPRHRHDGLAKTYIYSLSHHCRHDQDRKRARHLRFFKTFTDNLVIVEVQSYRLSLITALHALSTARYTALRLSTVLSIMGLPVHTPLLSL
jgi:hypothetical protein